MLNIVQHKNRKLYAPELGRYTNLSELKELVMSGTKFTVTDHQTGTDVTAHILSQILVMTKNVAADQIRQLILKGE